MPLYRGIVKKNPIEGGLWELHTDDGKSFQLAGGDGGLRRDGQKVEIEGKIDKDAMSIGMTGPVVAVKSWKKAEK
jgi:hypothetical protein